MTLSQIIMQYLGRRVSQLESAQTARIEKMGGLQDEITALELAQIQGKLAIERAETRLPSFNVCPECWIDRNLTSQLEATSMDVPEEVPEGHDIFRCERRFTNGIECQWYAIVEP